MELNLDCINSNFFLLAAEQIDCDCYKLDCICRWSWPARHSAQVQTQRKFQISHMIRTREGLARLRERKQFHKEILVGGLLAGPQHAWPADICVRSEIN